MFKRLVMGTALVAGMGASVGTASAEPYPVAVIQGVDKITARVSTIRAALDQTVRFGSLEIIVRHCDKTPPEEAPESAAFLDIWAVSPGRPTASVFRGWMFASSPALNALEHPVYDVWVIGCETLEQAEAAQQDGDTGAAAPDTAAQDAQ